MMSNKNVLNPPPIDVLGGFSPFQRQEPGSTAQGKLHLEPQLPPRGISALVAVSEMVSRMGDIKYLAKHGQTLRGQPLCIAERLDSLYHVVSFVMVQHVQPEISSIPVPLELLKHICEIHTVAKFYISCITNGIWNGSALQ
jgi:hypothetical protein